MGYQPVDGEVGERPVETTLKRDEQEYTLQFSSPNSRANHGFRKAAERVAQRFLRLRDKVAVPEVGAQTGLMRPLLSESGPVRQACVQKDTDEDEDMSRAERTQNMSRTKRVDELLFPVADEATLTVQGYLSRPEETVEDFYKKEGTFQAWARSSWFNNLSLSVILFNTIWIAIETDYNHAAVLCDAQPIFQVVDNFMCTFFVGELFVRLMAFKRKLRALSDPWYIFDTVLVASMVWETWIQVLLYLAIGGKSFGMGRTASILRVFRLARLTRVARVGKLLRSVPELMILAKAMFLALRSVIGILVMLTLVIYVFAILLTQLLHGQHVGSGKFDNVPKSMNFLLIQVLCGFDTEFMLALENASVASYATFLGYALIAGLTLMNMLVGILCNVVFVVSEAAKEENFVKDIEAQLEALAEKLDPDGDGRVSREEFINIISDYDLVQALNDTGVDVVAFVEYASFVFEAEADLSNDDFMRMIVQFRGDRVATVKELVSTRKYVTTLFESMQVLPEARSHK